MSVKANGLTLQLAKPQSHKDKKVYDTIKQKVVGQEGTIRIVPS